MVTKLHKRALTNSSSSFQNSTTIGDVTSLSSSHPPEHSSTLAPLQNGASIHSVAMNELQKHLDKIRSSSRSPLYGGYLYGQLFIDDEDANVSPWVVTEKAYYFEPEDADIKDGNDIRFIFSNSPIETAERESIEELKRYFSTRGVWLSPWMEDQCLRFLYATHFDISKAADLLIENIIFRTSSELPIYERDVHHLLDLGAAYWHGRDKNHRPLLILKFEKLGKLNLQDLAKLISYCFEFFLRYLCVAGRVENWVLLGDMKGKSMFNSSYTIVQNTMQILNSRYRGRMYRLYIVNAPAGISFFSGILKAVMPSSSLKKLELLSTDFKRVLRLQFYPHELEQQYGGDAPDVQLFYPWKFFPDASIHDGMYPSSTRFANGLLFKHLSPFHNSGQSLHFLGSTNIDAAELQARIECLMNSCLTRRTMHWLDTFRMPSISSRMYLSVDKFLAMCSTSGELNLWANIGPLSFAPDSDDDLMTESTDMSRRLCTPISHEGKLFIGALKSLESIGKAEDSEAAKPSETSLAIGTFSGERQDHRHHLNSSTLILRSQTSSPLQGKDFMGMQASTSSFHVAAAAYMDVRKELPSTSSIEAESSSYSLKSRCVRASLGKTAEEGDQGDQHEMVVALKGGGGDMRGGIGVRGAAGEAGERGEVDAQQRQPANAKQVESLADFEGSSLYIGSSTDKLADDPSYSLRSSVKTSSGNRRTSVTLFPSIRHGSGRSATSRALTLELKPQEGTDTTSNSLKKNLSKKMSLGSATHTEHQSLLQQNPSDSASILLGAKSALPARFPSLPLMKQVSTVQRAEDSFSLPSYPHPVSPLGSEQSDYNVCESHDVAFEEPFLRHSTHTSQGMRRASTKPLVGLCRQMRIRSRAGYSSSNNSIVRADNSSRKKGMC